MKAVEFVTEKKWSGKYKSSINCSHPRGFSQKAHCAGRKKSNESVETEAVCPDCGLCESHGMGAVHLEEACWAGYRKDGMKTMFGKRYPNCVKKKKKTEDVDQQRAAPGTCARTRAVECSCEGVNQLTESKETVTAVCVLEHSDKVKGTILFKQRPDGPTFIVGRITGLTPGQHGFHIHEFGDLSGGCETAGKHYNPDGEDHGDLSQGHVGDLGNVTADSQGRANFSIVAKRVDLSGDRSVVGRAVVVHENPDDLGQGGDEESLKTGNAGERLACGVITLRQTATENNNIDEGKRVPRKAGQPANSKKHSDLYTDENPKGTITGLKFATPDDAKASVTKIRNSGRSHAHKIQAAVAMEQRAKAAGKTEAASVYRRYINANKKTESVDQQSAEPLPYREGGSIVHDGVEYDFDTVMSMAEKLPTRQCSVDRLSWILEYDTPDQNRTNQADISFPLIVTKSVDGQLAVIDGLHRLNAAVRDRVKSLPVKYIPPSELKSATLHKEDRDQSQLEIIKEDLRKWFKDKWVRFGPDGKIRGDCARGSSKEGKPKCLPKSKAQSLGKKGRAKAAARKRRQDPNADRKGKAINVKTK